MAVITFVTAPKTEKDDGSREGGKRNTKIIALFFSVFFYGTKKA